jgi:hypothetical protein
LGEFFRSAHSELAADDLVRCEELAVLILDGKDGLRVADGHAPLCDEELHVAMQIEQAHRVGDTGSGLADTRGDFVLLERKFLGEADVACGFFHRVEILALEVLDECHFQNITIGGLALDDRHSGESEFAGGTPTSFTSDEFELTIHSAHDERLDDAVLTDRLHQIIKWRFTELKARLQGAGNHLIERHVAHALEVVRCDHRIGRGHAFPDECSKSFSECLLRHGGGSITQSLRQFQADLPETVKAAFVMLDGGGGGGHPLRVIFKSTASLGMALVIAIGTARAQQPAAPQQAREDSEVIAEAVPPDVVTSAVAAVAKLGDEVVLGRYQMAVERMNPLWKERTAKRMGMEELEKQLDAVAAEMVKQGISMISCKPQGQPRVLQVSPGKKTFKENGANVEKLVYTKWLAFVPTVTKFRIMRPGVTKPLVIEAIGYQVAISDKGANDWTFIDGSGLKAGDLRSLFITLPQDLELPPVEKREVR